MLKVIPSEFRNRRGLQKLRVLYAKQLKELHGDETAPSLNQLRIDIECIERELRRKPLIVSAATATTRK